MLNIPLVSVVIPSYNMESFISDAIISCLNQTYEKLEIIVIDDGSKDGTKRIVSQFGYPVFYYYQKNSGVSAARNFGIKMAKGSYISFLDADDIWLPSKIQKQILAIQKKSNIKVISCGYAIMDEYGKITKEELVRKNFKTREEQYRAISICQLVPSSASGILLDKKCIQKIGLFDEKIFIGEDWDMWLRILEYEQIYYLEEVLAIIRIKRKINVDRSIENEKSQVEKVIAKRVKMNYRRKAYSALYARLGSALLNAHNYHQAVQYLLMSIFKWYLPIFPFDFKKLYQYPRTPRYYLLGKSIFKVCRSYSKKNNTSS